MLDAHLVVERLLPVAAPSEVARVLGGAVRLPGEHVRRRFHRVCLVLLDLELELQELSASSSSRIHRPSVGDHFAPRFMRTPLPDTAA